MSRLICSLPNKSSPLDLIPKSTLKRFSHLFAPIISKLTSLSFSQSIIPASFKTVQVLTLLKKGNLDPTIPLSYRPISNLSTISKIIERLVHSRITSHVSSSPNFDPFQSALRITNSLCTGYLSPKDASLNYFGSLHALSSLNNLLIFLIFCQSDTHVNHSNPCTLVSSFINLFLQACLLVALFLTRLHVCGIHFLLTCAHRFLS